MSETVSAVLDRYGFTDCEVYAQCAADTLFEITFDGAYDSKKTEWVGQCVLTIDGWSRYFAQVSTDSGMVLRVDRLDEFPVFSEVLVTETASDEVCLKGFGPSGSGWQELRFDGPETNVSIRFV